MNQTTVQRKSSSSAQRSVLEKDPGLTGFLRLRPEQMVSYIRGIIAEATEVLEQVTADHVPDTWDGFIEPLIDVHDRLEQAWSRIDHLHAVVNSPKLRQVVQQGEPLLSRYGSLVSQHTKLFAKYQRLRRSPEFRRLSTAQQRVVILALHDFRLAGAHLPSADRQQIRSLRLILAKDSTTFSHRLLDATQSGLVETTNRKDLAGIPAAEVAEARQRAQQAKKPGWLFTIQAPSYHTVMRTALSRDLRRRLYHLSIRRASELGRSSMDTTPMIERILTNRLQMARRLGFRTFVELSLAKKMAGSAAQVTTFLKKIGRGARPKAIQERGILENSAQRQLHIQDLQPWDLDIAYEAARGRRFGFSQEELRQYFPHTAVLRALFELSGQVFGIRWRPVRNFKAYHRQVVAYDCYDRSGGYRGRLVFDLFARPSKQAGAWVRGDTSCRKIKGTIRRPVVFCVCNFPSPDRSGTSWLTHDDVHTLFHETGHALHHLLTDIDIPDVSGTSGVEWDAVELPSQWMQRFAWEPTLWAQIGRYSRRPIPKELQRRLLASQTFAKGLWVLRQIQLGLFDLLLHQQKRITRTTALRLWRTILRQYNILPTTSDNRLPNSFSHIFDGGYAAGYYSYMWAEVLSADAFEPLRNKPRQWSNQGRRFRQEILSVGGSRPAAESFRALRGRPPNIKPLLRSYGLHA